MKQYIKNIKWFLIAAACLLSTSCNDDWLGEAVTGSDDFTSMAEIDELLNGMYWSMNGWLRGGVLKANGFYSFASDELYAEPTGGSYGDPSHGWEVFYNRNSPFNNTVAVVEQTMYSGYNVSHMACIILKFFEEKGDEPFEKKNQWEIGRASCRERVYAPV